MMNKKGHTLMEVLVVLAVIGIIAALVLPSFIDNSKKTTVQTGLARGFELTQQGFVNLMSEAQNHTGNVFENIASIKKSDIYLEGDEYITDDNTFYDSTKSFLGTEDVDYDIASIQDYDGNNPAHDLISDFTAYKFNKANVVVMFQNITNEDIEHASNDDIISRVLIDANGTAAPNRFGRDIFLFGLTNSGHLIPAGSQQYNDFDATVAVGACSGNDVGNGTACAARVMADKWEIKY